jgi:hypothetical protein
MYLFNELLLQFALLYVKGIVVKKSCFLSRKAHEKHGWISFMVIFMMG